MSEARAQPAVEAVPIVAPTGFLVRTGRSLRSRRNWSQLGRFCIVGASGYIVNLAVYAATLHAFDVPYRAAATCSFLLAVMWNYAWNRTWTFRARSRPLGVQGLRFFVVSAAVYAANLGVLTLLVEWGGLSKTLAQAIAIVLVTPLNFLGNKIWSFR
jgi:putative flippase GtrA